MTAEEWLVTTEPERMLRVLEAGGRGNARKLRLFACACIRLSWDMFGRSSVCPAAVETSERYADDPTAEVQLRGAEPAVYREVREWENWVPYESSDQVDLSLSRAVLAVVEGASPRRFSVAPALTVVRHVADSGASVSALAGLLRDVFNPFRPVLIDPTALTPTVRGLAQAAYDERLLPSGELDPQRLSVLADALEEAGAGGEILGHLRGAGPHVRGCKHI